jgi:ABC-2 type transport system ATP-binding protein
VPQITLHNITKTYNPGLFKRKVRAVTDLNLAIHQGEVFGIVGPNGAGKSSTIRMILGMSRPDQGAILFRDTPIQHSDFRHHVGYLPENPYLYDYLNLEELLQFCGRTSGLDKKATLERGQALMEKLQLLEARRRPLRTFSKGMLQRAGICFALLHDPSIVILDEPMSGLDPLGRHMVFDLVLDLKSQGKTVFFCSHILSDVERLCDRIGVMVQGRLVRTLEKDEFLESSAQRVHLLLGSVDAETERRLVELPVETRHEPDGLLLSVSGPDLAQVSQALAAAGIDVQATRSNRFSLEDLFIATVREHTS